MRRPDLRVLTVNAGSSSLKLRVLDTDDEVLRADDLPAFEGGGEQLRAVLAELPQIEAVGHRIVHGGERFGNSVRIDAEVERALGELVDLAPLHQPKSLATLAAVAAALPGVPAVACFDTAFHTTIPPAAATYALPREWRERWPLRRYGFHGLSHAYAARRTAELIGRPLEELRVVSCHLGAGASLCAIDGGRSLDTTMGFTPLEGLVMTTRLSLPAGISACLFELDAYSGSRRRPRRSGLDAFLRRDDPGDTAAVRQFHAPRDYAAYVDGKPRSAGVRSLLAFGGDLAEGSPNDAGSARGFGLVVGAGRARRVDDLHAVGADIVVEAFADRLRDR